MDYNRFLQVLQVEAVVTSAELICETVCQTLSLAACVIVFSVLSSDNIASSIIPGISLAKFQFIKDELLLQF